MENRFFTKEQFNNLLAAEMNSAVELYELRKRGGIPDYVLGNYDFIFVSDSRDNLRALADFLIENYGYTIREIRKNGRIWELSGDATKFPVGYSRAIAKDELYTRKAARRDYDRSIELAPEFVADIINRAANKDEEGEYEEAIKDYSRAIELEPDNAMAYFNRGNSKFNKDGKSGACKDWLRARELGAEYSEERINENCR